MASFDIKIWSPHSLDSIILRAVVHPTLTINILTTQGQQTALASGIYLLPGADNAEREIVTNYCTLHGKIALRVGYCDSSPKAAKEVFHIAQTPISAAYGADVILGMNSRIVNSNVLPP